VNVKRKNPFKLILAAFFIIVAYFAFFPYPLGKELVPKPVWALDTGTYSGPTAGTGELTAENTAPFQLAGVFGYVERDGALIYKGNPLFRVALTDAGFINFARIGTTWIFQDIMGGRVFSFSGSGYPVLSRDGGRILTISTDLTGVREYDRGGEISWSRDFPSLITSLSVEPDYVLAGLLNGSLELIGRSGDALAEYTAAGSRISVILGCAVSGDGERVAAVAGVDGQFLIVLERQGTDYVPVSRIRLESDFRREIRMEFSPDNKYLAIEGSGSVHLYDCDTRRFFTIPLSGGLSGYAFLRDRESTAFLAGNGNRRELVMSKPFADPFFRETFSAGNVFIGALDDSVLLGIDAMLLRIDLEEM
jgi:hypothetical protein